MFKAIKRWVFWYKRTKAWKRYITEELVISRRMGKATPPTPEQLAAFKKEWDLGWDSHMVTRVERRKTYYEANIGI